MNEKSVIAVHACGFENENEICQVAKFRLTVAISKARKNNINNIIISGGPPYQKGSKLLAHLAGEWLITEDALRDFSGSQPKKVIQIHYAIDCFDSSTDIQNIIKIAKEKNFSSIFAISSYWHLWALKPLYKYWSRKLSYQGRIYILRSHKMLDRYFTGKKIRIVYFFYAFLIKLALFSHLFEPLNNFLSSKLSKRKNGYPATGCS